MKQGDIITFLLGGIPRTGIVVKVLDKITMLVALDSIFDDDRQFVVKLEPRWVAQ